MIYKIVSATAREDVERGINEYLRLGYQPDGNLVHSKNKNNHNILSIRMIKPDKNNSSNNSIVKCKLISIVIREDVERGINKYLILDFEPYGDLISSRAVRYGKEMDYLTILMVKKKNSNKTIKKCKIISSQSMDDFNRGVAKYERQGFKTYGNMINHEITKNNKKFNYYTILMLKI